MIRLAFWSGLAASGLVGRAAPVAGSTRMTAPSRVTGSPAVRRSWLRSAPPSAVGGLGAAPAPSAPNSSAPTEWLGYCWHQPSISTCSDPLIWLPEAVRRDSRPETTQPSAVGPGGVGHGSESTPGAPQRGAGASE